MSTESETKKKMEVALDHFKKELNNLRSNRANPAMLDSVIVEAYGAQMKIRDLANITVPEARQLLVAPFDGSMAGPISKGIEKANLGLQPMLEGSVVRMTIPPLDENMRKDIAKQGKKKAEEAKVAVREVRRKQNEHVRKQKTDGDITEDVMKREEKQIQELTDKYCKLIDELFVEKEKEIMTV